MYLRGERGCHSGHHTCMLSTAFRVTLLILNDNTGTPKACVKVEVTHFLLNDTFLFCFICLVFIFWVIPGGAQGLFLYTQSGITPVWCGSGNHIRCRWLNPTQLHAKQDSCNLLSPLVFKFWVKILPYVELMEWEVEKRKSCLDCLQILQVPGNNISVWGGKGMLARLE